MNPQKARTRNNQSGFTLIELIIVVAVMGFLVAITPGIYFSSRQRARDTSRQNDIKEYQTAVENFAFGNNSFYPNSNGNTISATTQLCGYLGTYISKCPDDPYAGKDAKYRYNYQSSSEVGAAGSATALNWVLWTALEGTSNNWVVCSNRKTGKIASSVVIAGGTCPL